MHKNITFSAICLQPCKALQGSPSPPLQHPFGDSRGDFFLLFCKLFFEKNPHICAFFAFIDSFILKMFKSCLAILLSWCYNTITEVYITPCRGDCVMGKQTYASTPRYRIYPTAQQRQQIDINRYRAVKYSSWGEFKRQIRYKSERYGRQLVSVSRFFASSQLCSVCGYKYPRAKRLTVRNWTCPVCGAPHDRDANAAINILHEGLRLVDQASAA